MKPAWTRRTKPQQSRTNETWDNWRNLATRRTKPQRYRTNERNCGTSWTYIVTRRTTLRMKTQCLFLVFSFTMTNHRRKMRQCGATSPNTQSFLFYYYHTLSKLVNYSLSPIYTTDCNINTIGFELHLSCKDDKITIILLTVENPKICIRKYILFFLLKKASEIVEAGDPSSFFHNFRKNENKPCIWHQRRFKKTKNLTQNIVFEAKPLNIPYD